MKKYRGRKIKFLIGTMVVLLMATIVLILVGMKNNEPVVANNNEQNEWFKVVSKLPTTRTLDPSSVTIQQGNLYAYVDTSTTISSSISPYRDHYGIGETVKIVVQFDKIIASCPNAKMTIKFGTGSNIQLNGTPSGSTIIFTHTISSSDNGELNVKGLSGKVTDNDGNQTMMGLPTEGVQYTASSTIIADTIIEKDAFYEPAGDLGEGDNVTFTIKFHEKVYFKNGNNIEELTTSNLNPYVNPRI